MESETVAIETDEDGNFSSPVLDRIFEVWDEYEHEEIEQDGVLEVLDRVEARILEQIKEMEEAGKEPDVDVHDPNRVAIFMAFQAHLDGVEKMRSFFATDDSDLVDEAFEILQRATNQMMNGLHGLIVDDRESAPKLCVRCSAPNPREATVCAKCNAILPALETANTSRLIAMEGPDTDSTDAPDTTPNYIAMSEAHEEWSNGRITPDDFFKTALTVRDRLSLEQQEVTELQSAEKVSPEESEYLRDRSQVLDQNIDAVEQLLGGLEEDNLERIGDGMFAFAQATIALLEVEKTMPSKTSPS